MCCIVVWRKNTYSVLFYFILFYSILYHSIICVRRTKSQWFLNSWTAYRIAHSGSFRYSGIVHTALANLKWQRTNAIGHKKKNGSRPVESAPPKNVALPTSGWLSRSFKKIFTTLNYTVETAAKEVDCEPEVRWTHRVGRVLSVSPVVGIGTPPPLLPQASLPPHPLVRGGGHTRLPKEGTYTVVLYILLGLPGLWSSVPKLETGAPKL